MSAGEEEEGGGWDRGGMTHASQAPHTRHDIPLLPSRDKHHVHTPSHADGKKNTKNTFPSATKWALNPHGRGDDDQVFLPGASDYRGCALLGSEYTSRQLQDARSRGHCSAKGHATLNLLTTLRVLRYQHRRNPPNIRSQMWLPTPYFPNALIWHRFSPAALSPRNGRVPPSFMDRDPYYEGNLLHMRYY